MNDVEGERGDTLLHALGVVQRRWAILLACIVGCAALATAMHLRADPTYEATAHVAFGMANLSDTALEVNSSGADPARDAATNVLIARSGEVAAAAAKQLHSARSPADLLDDVSVDAAPNADVLDITAKGASAQSAQALANAFAHQYIAFQARTQLEGIDQAERALRQQLASVPADSSRANDVNDSLRRLAELRAVANGNARIIGEAGRGEPTGAGLKLTIVLGAVLGTALGIGIVFILEAVDRRLTRIEDFEREYGLPALTAVPQTSFRYSSARDRRAHLEPYRILRSALDMSARDRDCNVVLLTSAVPGEGKTTAAVDLAQAVALTGRPVLLMELDLRRPTLSRHMDLDPRRGVTNVLAGRDEIADVLVHPLADIPNLSVLPSGPIPPNPSELLASDAFEDLIVAAVDAAGQDAMVIIDAPPLLPVADTQVLLNSPAIEAVLVVARAEKTTRDEVRRTAALLERHLLPPLGLIITGAREGSRYGYGPLEEVPDEATVVPDLVSRVGRVSSTTRRVDA